MSGLSKALKWVGGVLLASALIEMEYPPGNVAVSRDGRIFTDVHPFAQAHRFGVGHSTNLQRRSCAHIRARRLKRRCKACSA